MSAEASENEPPKAEEPPAEAAAAEAKAEDAAPATEAPAAEEESAAKPPPKKKVPPPPEPLPWCMILGAAVTIGALVGVGVYWLMTSYFFAPSGIQVTQDTWDDMTAGKTVFLKFYAPWCGHCKKMKPDWDVLMDEYKESPTILVGDVDCTAEANKDLCNTVGVKGFPTLKHGNPDDLQDYSGGRSLKDIREFAATLKPGCSPARIDLCDETKKAEIERLLALGDEKREEMIKEKQAEVDEIEASFKKLMEGLQAKYQEASKKKDEGVEEIKNSGLGLLKAVNAYEKKKAETEGVQEER